VQWIVDRLCQRWEEGASFLLDQGDHPHEAHYLKLDCSKSRDGLGWTPRWSLEAALESIVAWTKVYRDGGDVREECLRQIREYENC
jgi:CDP-glucose 4,6-dehydratase